MVVVAGLELVVVGGSTCSIRARRVQGSRGIVEILNKGLESRC